MPQSAEYVTIAIDAMGGDLGPEIVFAGTAQVLNAEPDVRVRFYGPEAQLAPLLASYSAEHRSRVEICHAPEMVTMDEDPRHAIKNKKQSSMRLAVNAVRDGDADACISCGNTGALMATAKFVLKTIVGIDRPAIMGSIPAEGGQTWMLDMGANAICTPEQLVQFALMGATAIKHLEGLPNPRVGLLNIGAEALKGTPVVHQAHALLQTQSFNYIGYVEANDIYSDRVDVVVTDGFTGNVALKATEGTAKLIRGIMRTHLTQGLLGKIFGVLALPALLGLRKRLDPRRYNGASLLGLRGIAVKSHGGTDKVGFACALQTTINEVRQHVPDVLAEALINYNEKSA